jgi:CheY-like chemotaxis protein
MRILVAEDEPTVAEGLMRSLRQAGYAVDCAKDGDEADTALEANEFDLLILDIGLPKKSGLEVLKRLRSRGSKVPVLILTARDSLNDRVTGLDAGADDYLAKPFRARRAGGAGAGARPPRDGRRTGAHQPRRAHLRPDRPRRTLERQPHRALRAGSRPVGGIPASRWPRGIERSARQPPL